MRKKYNLEIDIPEGVNGEFADGVLRLKKGDVELKKIVFVPRTKVMVKDNKIIFNCSGANKKDISIIKTYTSHIKNMLKGLDEKFVYELEICHVHFPMTVKVEKDKVVISNFLGEKINRVGKILEGVEVEIKGNKITVSSNDIQSAGQTAANLEKASKVFNKDRRIFQDGIFMTHKPRGEI